MDIILSNKQPYQFEIFDRITKFNKEKNPQLQGTNAWNFGGLFGFYAMEDDKIIGGIVGNEKMNFELIAEIKDWPKGITRYEFIKYV